VGHSKPADRAMVRLTQDPKDAVEDTPVIYPWHAARLVRQHRPDRCPFVVGELVAHNSSPRFRGLNHDPRAASTDSQFVAIYGEGVAFGAKQTS
jgi:hypothetical protein